MTFFIHHLRLRAETSSGSFGRDISFTKGLNILRADSAKGKSTCLQGLLYALGLERMISPSREISWGHVMTSRVGVDNESGGNHLVLESWVSVEIENAQGRVITVRRAVKSQADTRLITVFEGPQLTTQAGQYSQRDYFVNDPEAEQQEVGFHRFLEMFIGWKLPSARRLDGSETTLPLETVFPFLYVEQKLGWSQIPAASPNSFQIRDIGLQVIEFLMGLDTRDLDIRRQKLDLELAFSKSALKAKYAELCSLAQLSNARVQGIASSTTISTAEVESAFLEVPSGDEWLPLDEIIFALRQRVIDFRDTSVPSVEDTTGITEDSLGVLRELAAQKEASRDAIFRSRKTENVRYLSLVREIATLESELCENHDAWKLRISGSTDTATFEPDYCPTCLQPVRANPMAHQPDMGVLSAKENIDLIGSKLSKMYVSAAEMQNSITNMGCRMGVEAVEYTEITSRISALQADCVAPRLSPSTFMLEERLRDEARLEAHEHLHQQFEEQKVALIKLAKIHNHLLAAHQSLPPDRMSAEDQAKLARLTSIIRLHSESYGISTVEVSEMVIVPDNFRPQTKEFEFIGNLSASETIRLKWAYHLGLLELSRTSKTNHPGFVVFDEPCQQAVREVNFQRLLENAATAKSAGQQVIIATSEDRGLLEGFLENIDCHYEAFDGYMLKALSY